jgi:hypothetical protein
MNLSNGPILGVGVDGSGHPWLFDLTIILFVLCMVIHVKYFRNGLTLVDYIKHYIWIAKRKWHLNT